MAEKPLFRDIHGDVDEQEMTEIESLCMKCGENGVTRIMLTRIPMFKDVAVMSFSCPHCGHKNNEIQSTGRVQEEGSIITLEINDKKDLDRQLVKTDTATVTIPELQFEIPAKSQPGEVTTIEGVLKRVEEGLQEGQLIRKIMDPETHDKIQVFINQLRKCQSGDQLFTLVLDDPSGNSFIENYHAPQLDPSMTIQKYRRSVKQDIMLGLKADDDNEEENLVEGEPGPISQDEVLSFPLNCPDCESPCETRMKLVDIPHFKQVIIMAMTCDRCGHKSNEVKSGGNKSPIRANGLSIIVDIFHDCTKRTLRGGVKAFVWPRSDINIFFLSNE
jgi:zinc finger protein